MSKVNMLKVVEDLREEQEEVIECVIKVDSSSLKSIIQNLKQGVEKEDAIDHAINFLLEDPFVKVAQAGDLLSLVVDNIQLEDLQRNDNYCNLVVVAELLNDNIDDFDCETEKTRDLFTKSLKRLKKYLIK